MCRMGDQIKRGEAIKKVSNSNNAHLHMNERQIGNIHELECYKSMKTKAYKNKKKGDK